MVCTNGCDPFSAGSIPVAHPIMARSSNGRTKRFQCLNRSSILLRVTNSILKERLTIRRLSKMKYFLLAALALTGCATTDYGSLAKTLPEPPTVNQTTIGFNDSADVSYACLQSEVNPALVWDTCHFHNFAPKMAQMCIVLSYNKNGSPIVTSRTVCSGPLQPGETKDNYAAFTPKHGRDDLEINCGSNMVLCKMSAQEVK